MQQSRRWSDLEFISAVASSTSIAQVLKKLGLRPAGGNYDHVHNHVRRLGLDTSHFKGQAHLKGGSHNWNGKPLAELLVEHGGHGTDRLKKRLIKAGFLNNQCATCGLQNSWQGQPIVLHMDHQNGNRRDNRLSNLRLLCPNCHSQTATYCGRNNKQGCGGVGKRA